MQLPQDKNGKRYVKKLGAWVTALSRARAHGSRSKQRCSYLLFPCSLERFEFIPVQTTTRFLKQPSKLHNHLLL